MRSAPDRHLVALLDLHGNPVSVSWLLEETLWTYNSFSKRQVCKRTGFQDDLLEERCAGRKKKDLFDWESQASFIHHRRLDY